MPFLIQYFVIAVTIKLVVVLFKFLSSTGEIRCFGQAMSYLFWMTLGPGAGMTLGAFLRLWLIYTREGMRVLLKARLFWLAGSKA